MSGPGKRSFFKTLAEKIAGPSAAHRVYICGGPTCCQPELGRAPLAALQRRLAELGLDSGEGKVEARKSACMNVCGDGPVAFVAPDAVWYLGVSGARLDRIAREHLKDGKPVEEFAFNPPPDARPPE